MRYYLIQDHRFLDDFVVLLASMVRMRVREAWGRCLDLPCARVRRCARILCVGIQRACAPCR